MHVAMAKSKFEICSPIEAFTVSKTSLIWEGSSFTLLFSKKAISCYMSARMYRLRKSVTMFSAKCCQKAKNR